jgi:hypothetical protein
MPVVAIQSIEFNVYLRMNGRDVTKAGVDGSGIVNCQYNIAPWELFEISAPDIDSAVTIASVSFPNVYLRMDGRAITQFDADGGGTVNCQYGAGPWEKFRFEEQPDGTLLIGSVAFAGAYLRIDGRGVDEAEPHGGTVNCQYGPGPWEKVRLIPQ